MNPLRTYQLFTVLVFLWCLAIVAAPVLQSVNNPAGNILYDGFSKVCHQLEDRSLHLAGFKFAVCSRCSSIYGSFLVSLLLVPVVRSLRKSRIPRISWLMISMLPMCLDVVLNSMGALPSSMISRIITGVIFGAALPWYLVPTLLEAISQLRDASLVSGGIHARKTE